MVTYRLVPESDWERAMSALDDAAAALRRCGRMTLPDIASDTPTTGQHRTGQSRSAAAGRNGRAGDGVLLARQVIDRVAEGGPRHIPRKFNRTGPKIADFVAIITNGDPFRISDLIDPLMQYVELKNTRREAGGQVRTAVTNDSRFQQVDRGVFQRSAAGNDAHALPLTEGMT